MTTTLDRPAVDDGAKVEELAGRLFMEGVGMAHLATAYLGVRLGLFSALAERPGITAAELATVADLDERYVREWLQAETIAGLVIADAEDLTAACFTLAPGVVETLVNETSPAYLGGMTLVLPAVGRIIPQLLDAFRTGAGVPFTAYGPEAIAAQAALNRPSFVNELGTNWLPSIPDVHARLQDSKSPAVVADIGCGVGWAAIELAKAYPHVRVDGFDVDDESIQAARRNAKQHGVDDRVSFQVVDAATASYGDRKYDLVLFLECLHDIGRPVEALEAARATAKDDGVVLVMDERTADTRPPAGDPMETFFATISTLWCLPQSRVVPDCEAPGTVMRPSTLQGLVR
ncbi:MAG: class I SAM-dependent methyltransferase, partial [Frankia sp.]|nr:class I SAM-dependent methyltransferase [Frankia sp.]